MIKTIGFIGCGKMAQAMIEGILRSKLVTPDRMIASASSRQTLDLVSEKFAIRTTSDNQDVAKAADVLILAVGPSLYGEIIGAVKPFLKKDAIVVTIAAGISLRFMKVSFGETVKVVRTMPNTPSLVGQAMTALCPNELVTDDDMKKIIQLFNSFGKTEVLREDVMDAVPAISGSSPAYVYLFIEALADGAVRDGIPRKQAYNMAAQAVLGAATMVLETGLHPGVLKDQVCTPGGATIEAISTLEKAGFRSTVLAAMESCTNKSKGLNQDN